MVPTFIVFSATECTCITHTDGHLNCMIFFLNLGFCFKYMYCTSVILYSVHVFIYNTSFVLIHHKITLGNFTYITCSYSLCLLELSLLLLLLILVLYMYNVLLCIIICTYMYMYKFLMYMYYTMYMYMYMYCIIYCFSSCCCCYC